MWLTIVLERHLLPGSNLKIRFNAPSPGFSFQQRECTTSRREFLWKSFHSARIKFSPRMLSRFCFSGRLLTGILEKGFFSAGSQQVQISWWDSCRDTRQGFFPGRIPPGKRDTPPGKRVTSAGSRWAPGILAGSRQDPSTYFTKVAQYSGSQLAWYNNPGTSKN